MDWAREGRRGRAWRRERVRARRERKMPTMKNMERGMDSVAKERDQPSCTSTIRIHHGPTPFWIAGVLRTEGRS